jgi:hypothetical protein
MSADNPAPTPPTDVPAVDPSQAELAKGPGSEVTEALGGAGILGATEGNVTDPKDGVRGNTPLETVKGVFEELKQKYPSGSSDKYEGHGGLMGNYSTGLLAPSVSVSDGNERPSSHVSLMETRRGKGYIAKVGTVFDGFAISADAQGSGDELGVVVRHNNHIDGTSTSNILSGNRAEKAAEIITSRASGKIKNTFLKDASDSNGNAHEALEELQNPRVESLAVPLARDYAEKNYPKRDDGTFEPAWRGVNGEKPFKGKSPEDLIAEGMSPEEASKAVIDIANTPYDQYSEHWKSQNRGGAEYLITLLDERGAEEITNLDLSDSAVISELGNLIHENWISRNEWVKDPEYGNPDLAKPFDDLSPEEQQKDIDQIGVLKTWITQQSQK